MFFFFFTYAGVQETQDTGLSNRSVSFSGVIKKPARGPGSLTRVESDTTGATLNVHAQSPTIEEGAELVNGGAGVGEGGENFASKLAMIQSQLQEKIGEKPSSKPTGGTASR